MADEKTSRRLNEMDVGESATVDVTAVAAAAAAVSLRRSRLFVCRLDCELLIN